MIGNGPLNGFKVKPRSVDLIRQAADNVRNVLGVEDDVSSLHMGVLLDTLIQYGITYDVLEHDEMPHLDVEACCIPENLLICIRQDVYERACNNEPRARFTVIHEFGHLILSHRRTINREEQSPPPKTFEDSEWQANQFAAEFLMPLSAIKKYNLFQRAQIESFFNVSGPAATRRLNQLNTRREI